MTLVLPFLSGTWIADERGTYDKVTDIRKVRAARDNGKTPKYDCVRLVWNGDWIHQLCDPMDPHTGRTTGVVRAAIEELWHDLKRAHYIDFATRAMAVTVPFQANNAGVRSRVTFMLEFTSSGTVLPSFDTQMRVVRPERIARTRQYVFIALYFTIFFCATEIVELCGMGPGSYFSDLVPAPV